MKVRVRIEKSVLERAFATTYNKGSGAPEHTPCAVTRSTRNSKKKKKAFHNRGPESFESPLRRAQVYCVG